jgi:hypothetical protein
MGSTYILRKGDATLSDLADGQAAIGGAVAAGGKWYYLDPTHGTAGGDGLTPKTANSNLETLYALLRDGYNDGIFFIGGATAFNPSAAITWSKSYAHLIGLSSPLFGLGQRCRVVTQAAIAATTTITFSGSGCVVSNVQFYNEKASGACGVAIVSGSRNTLINTFFMVPVSVTAASYSLKMDGSENLFYRCTIGQFTNARSAATYGLWLHGAAAVSRNKFVECEFLSWAAANSHVHVLIDADIVTVPWVTWFENCLFHNFGTQLTQAIDDNSTATTHQTVIRGRDSGVLNAAAVADTLTYIFAPDVASNVSGQLMIAVAES